MVPAMRTFSEAWHNSSGAAQDSPQKNVALQEDLTMSERLRSVITEPAHLLSIKLRSIPGQSQDTTQITVCRKARGSRL